MDHTDVSTMTDHELTSQATEVLRQAVKHPETPFPELDILHAELCRRGKPQLWRTVLAMAAPRTPPTAPPPAFRDLNNPQV